MSDPEARLAVSAAPSWASEGPALVVGFGDSSVAAEVQTATVFEQDLRAFRSVPPTERRGVAFAPFLEPAAMLERAGPVSSTGFTSAVVRLPKSVEHQRMLLAMLGPALEPDAPVVLVGHNSAGIRSAGKRLREFIGEPQVIDYRFHCRALLARTSVTPSPFDPRAWRATFREQLGSTELVGVSYPGVFSHGSLDPATRLLIETAVVPEDARVLEIGCGAGMIAAWLAHRVAGKVHAVDVHALALHATFLTAAMNGVHDRVMVWGSDLFSDVGERYSHILSNAPFHEGVRTSTGVARRLIAEAPTHLEGGGELWLVGNRFLHHGEQLARAFSHVTVEAEDGRYRVWRARR